MDFHYLYSSYIWHVLASAAFLAVLEFYAVRRRRVPGAVPFIILAGLTMLYVPAEALKMVAKEEAAKIFWFKFRATLLLPLVSAALCFVLEYAGLGRWLNRRAVALLALIPFIYVLLILTNDSHHLVWSKIWFDGYLRAEFGPANWGFISYGYLIGFLHVMVLVLLFIRSPRHRWMAAILILDPFITRGTYLFHIVNWNPVAPFDPMLIAVSLSLLPYAVAILGFRMFDVVPVARDTVLDQMAEGMLVLDTENRIADFNATAQKILDIVGPKAIGRDISKILQSHPGVLAFIRDSGAGRMEAALGTTPPGWYQVVISSLEDRRGFQLGRLIWFYDITEQKRAQACILDQQRTLAIMEERELLARELHDGIGQLLAAAQLQAKSAIEVLDRGETGSAASCLRSLAEVTQEAKDAVRSYLRGVKSGTLSEEGLLAWLRRYLNHYSRDCGIRTEMIVPPEFTEKRIGSAVKVQLQPIIQEALMNVRRHAKASSARVIFASRDDWLEVTIEDHGQGFDTERLSGSEGFGLLSMRGRAEAVGGSLEVVSAPGQGTRVIVQIPYQKEEP
jgi:signal transduction histidine kinase